MNSTTVRNITPHVRHVEAPAAIRQLPAWVLWRYEAGDGPKPRKVPYYANGRRRAGKQGTPEDLAGLTTFDAARAAAARRGFDGVGFACLPQWGITALDFDACILPDGSLHPEVARVVAASYAEFSPSGQGVRAFFCGTLPTGKSHASAGHDYGFEVFSTTGFVTFTGNVLPECELLGTDTDVSPITPDVRALHASRFPRAEAPPANITADPGEVEALLALLDPSMGHDDWLHAGMAIHHALGEGAFHLWDQWSAASDKYPGSETLAARWASFGKGGGPEVTIGTLRKLAGRVGGGPASPDEFEVVTDQDVEAARQREDAAAAARFTFVRAADFASTTSLPWIVKGVLPQAGLAVLYGASGSGKSFMALDLAGAIAQGIEWRGHRCRQGSVAYVAAEGAGGFRKRLAAYGQAKGVDLAALPLWVLPAAPNLMEPKDARDVIAAVRTLGPVSVIVVDTFAQVTPGANENAGEDMGKALGYCRRIHEATGALVLLVHHSGKDQAKGARGWSGIRAACDAELEVTREPTGRCLRLTKSKDGEDGTEWGFDLDVVQLGLDEDLDPITSCVVVEAAVPVPGGQALRKLGPVEKIVNDVIQEFAKAQTEGIEVSPVLAEAVRRMPAPEGRRDTRKQHARRALESLCKGDTAPYWLQDDGLTLSVV